MTIKELKEELNKFDDNDLVIMSKDGEGIGIRELTFKYIEAGYSEEDLLENGVNAIVLYPTN